MKILKWILIIIGAIIVLFLVYSASQPNQLNLEESITIDAPAEKVYAEIINFPEWNNWAVWSQLDPNMKSSYSEEMGKVGSFSEWKSENQMVGNGRQDVVEVRENEYMKAAMQFDGMDGTAYAEFILEPTDEGTLIRWTFSGAETPFYLNFINSLMEPMLRESYTKSLNALKEYIESMPAAIVSLPEGTKIVDLDGQAIISILDSTDAAGISKLLRELYTELSIFAETTDGITLKGMPLAIYHTYSPEKVVMEAAMPIEGTAKEKGRVKVGNLPSGKAIMGIFYGDYNGTEDMHYAISDFAASNYTMAGPPWEVYANDPTLVDSAEVETHIYYPIIMN
jgi:effector-binding domain-containing protein